MRLEGTAGPKSETPEAPHMLVFAFTGGATISSRRFRVEQYIPKLHAIGIDVHENIARFGSWPPKSRLRRPLWFLRTVLNRVGPIAESRRYDLTLLQRELVSTKVTLEPWAGRPLVLDVDDAVWLTSARARRSFEALVRMSDGVICGNDYIASNVRQWNDNVLVLPTAVNTDRFRPNRKTSGRHLIIGWSGLHAGAKYLLSIESALYRVLRDYPDAILRVVSDAPPEFSLLSTEMYEYIKWSPDNEVRTMQEMDIGLMPVDDSPWSLGKCSYKMLLYMACGIPVVVSPIGMNAEVLARGEVGLGPRSESEWVDALSWLLRDGEARAAMGRVGRQVVERHYSLENLVPRLGAYLMTFKK